MSDQAEIKQFRLYCEDNCAADNIVQDLKFLTDENLTYIGAVWKLEVNKNFMKFTASRPTLDYTSLVINSERLHWKVFFTLPQSYAANLVRLEIQLENRQEFIPAPTIQTPVEMKSLKHIVMDINLFLELNNRVIKFTTDKLETIVLNRDPVEPDSNDVAALISLLKRQTNLKSLQFPGDFGSIFNESFQLTAQLTDIYLRGGPDLNEEQQNNLADFLMSQKCIEGQKFFFFTDILGNKMRTHKRKFMDLPIESQNFKISNDTRFGHDFFELLELHKYDHRPNAITRKLKVYIHEVASSSLSFIAYKFPNLVELKIGMGVSETKVIELKDLSALKQLETLELEYIPQTEHCSCQGSNGSNDYCVRGEISFCKLELNNLKKLVFIDKSDNEAYESSFVVKHLDELKEFLSLNDTIEDLTLRIVESVVQRDWEVRRKQMEVLKLAFEKLTDLKSLQTTWIVNPNKEEITNLSKQLGFEYVIESNSINKLIESPEILFTKEIFPTKLEENAGTV